MSDFFSDGWSHFVAAATIVSLIACLGLLYIASRRKPMADDNSTGHVWDENLVELNNPLPLWWVVLFILTVLFSFAYLALYPGAGSMAGTLKWSSAGALQEEERRAVAEMSTIYAKYRSQPAEALAKDGAAMAIGERLFINNCAACHGSNARGSKGYPDLTDGDWLHGGTAEKIAESITKGRTGTMPPMAAAVGSPKDVQDVAQYVLKIAGSPHNAIAAAAGRSKFTTCAACHGLGGEGNLAIGAPNLTDKVWLHGWGEATIVDIVNRGRVNVMPAQGGRLTEDQIHVLTGYVWGLSHKGLPSPK